MSRPPYPHSAHSTGGEQTGDLGRLDYLPLEYADLLALEDDLAVIRLARPRPEMQGDVDEADVARTFMELSALVGHVLSVYQRHQAGEAFISTAQAPSSLVRHAHRLAYDPDPGLAASGYAVLFTKERAGGTIESRLPLASVPLGESKAQDYETRDDVVVDAELSELVPVHAQQAVSIPSTARQVRLQGVGHGLERGDVVALVAPEHWRGLLVESVEEDVARDVTTVALDSEVAAALAVSAADPPVLLAHPALALRPLAADADPVLWPPAAVKAATGTKPTTSSKYWYEVERADGGGYAGTDVYLSEKIGRALAGDHVLRSTGSALKVLKVTAETVAAVTLRREVEESFPYQKATVTKTDSTFTVALTDDTLTQAVSGHLSGNVTAIKAVDSPQGTTPVQRTAQPFPADWLADWDIRAPLAATEPNPAQAVEPLELPGLLPALTPGRPLVFTDHAETVAQVVAVRRAELDAAAGLTRIWWDPVTAPPAAGWPLADLKVFGNVARVSHGRTVQETLGGSDGVTPFQRFALRESPVTILPGVAGGEPELEVRVDDVLWERVQDFAASGPDDRHYRSTVDEAHVTSVVFGDGRNGAVPPSGKKNVAALYRVGLGRAGDVEPRRLSRLKRAHPLLDRVVNLTPISGGTEPANPAAIRSQSTRWIRTFDRAVSVSDLADLALTMPGIARAASRWDQAQGVVLVVATSAGDMPPARDAVRAFLDARRDVTVPLVLRGAQPLDVFVGIDVEPDPAYLVEIVKAGVRTALHGDQEDAPGMFTFPARGLGQPAYRSEVYARLEAVAGVVGVRVRRFDTGDPADVVDVIPAQVDEWLRLEPNHLDMAVASPGSTS